jgi:hypothetical protein
VHYTNAEFPNGAYIIWIDEGHFPLFSRKNRKNPLVYIRPKTINTRLPLSNPFMWQFEKEKVPPKLFSWHYFGNLLCFSSYPHHSTTLQPNKCYKALKIRLLGQFFFNILMIFWPELKNDIFNRLGSESYLKSSKGVRFCL